MKLAERSGIDVAQRRIQPPVHFVCPPEHVWAPLRDRPQEARLTEADFARLAIQHVDVWIQMTFLYLRDHGDAVTFGEDFEPEAINIASNRDFGRATRDLESFVVVPRADYNHPAAANFVIHQNFLKPAGRRTGAVHHWPQPGLMKRDPARGTEVRTVAFKGHPLSACRFMRSEGFVEALEQRGLRFENDSQLAGELHWADYRGVDILVAVRNMGRYRLAQKPASKLVNAWHAEVPAILGPEAAFQELRESELDYIEVRTQAETLAAIDRLANEPELYAAMVENGRRRARRLGDAQIRQEWIDLLNGPIRAEFDRWRRIAPGMRAAICRAKRLLSPASGAVYRACRALERSEVAE